MMVEKFFNASFNEDMEWDDSYTFDSRPSGRLR